MARPNVRDPKPSQAQVRATRRELSERIRDDWTYLGPHAAYLPDANRGTEKQSIPLADIIALQSKEHRHPAYSGRLSATHTTRSPEDDSGYQQDPYTIDESRVLSWKEPYYASSDPSSDEESDNEVLNTFNASQWSPRRAREGGNGIGNRLKRRSLRLIGVNVDKGYEQENESEQGTHSDGRDPMPDAFSAEQTAKMQELLKKKHDRKVRRRNRFEEEMDWNLGLRFWESRREAWCCAKTVIVKTSQEFPVEGDTSDESTGSDPSEDVRSSNEGTRSPVNLPRVAGQRRSTSRSTSQSSAMSPGSRHARSSSSPRPAPRQKLSESNDSPHRPKKRVPKFRTPLLPVTAPLLPTSDPTRTSMSPTLYPSIYSKVVVQSLTPSVPINLSHLIPALVEGWKADGEWPPPAAPASAPTTVEGPKKSNSKSSKSKGSAGLPTTGRRESKRNSTSRPLSWVLPSASNNASNATRNEPPPDHLRSSFSLPSGGTREKRDSVHADDTIPEEPPTPKHEPLEQPLAEKDGRTSNEVTSTNGTRSSTDRQTDKTTRRHSRAARPLSWIAQALHHEQEPSIPRASASKSTSVPRPAKGSSRSRKSGAINREKPLPAPPVQAPPAHHENDLKETGSSPLAVPRDPKSTTRPSPSTGTSASTAASARSSKHSPTPSAESATSTSDSSRRRGRPLSTIFHRERETEAPTAGSKESAPAREETAVQPEAEPPVNSRVRARGAVTGLGGRIRKRLSGSAGDWSLASAA